MQRILSFEQAPPISIPLRFFLVAPLFAAAAALLLLWSGPDAFVSRWSPTTLSLTHLLTLGFLAMTMVGALLQILPVVAGADVPEIKLTANVVHTFLLLGTIVLCAAFWWMLPVLFKLAIPLLLIAFLWMLAAALYAVLTAQGKGVTLIAIRLALAGLAVTLVLGVILAASLAWPLNVPFVLLVNLHATWGLLGWVSLLIIGVAFQVVPMFQVTPVYPDPVTRWLAGAVFVMLVAWSGVVTLSSNMPAWILSLLTLCIAASLATFSLTTLHLLWKRKRPAADPSAHFWRIGLTSLLLCTVIWTAGELAPGIAAHPNYPLILGILFIVGFAYSIVNGMLYKIVPFLVWYHLQANMVRGQGKAPNVKKIVTDRVANAQCVAHLIGLALLIAAVFLPHLFAQAAGAAFALSSLWLWVNLVNATLTYRRIASLQGATQAS